MSHPLVSVIVPTYNSSEFLDKCLSSIVDQSYENIELIVVDNNSTDDTKKIAKKYTKQVFNKGPERSAQRNYGVAISSGSYVVIIDSDMVLNKDVISSCVDEVNSSNNKALVIPEESFGEGFWAKCKKFERSFYVGVEWMEAARFFEKGVYYKTGGYNESMVSGEDWDLSQRVEAIANVGRVNEYIMHNEGKLSLLKTLKKKYYYSKLFSTYKKTKEHSEKVSNQTSVFKRCRLFLSSPLPYLKQPVVGIGMLFMKTCEFAVGGFGYLMAGNKNER